MNGAASSKELNVQAEIIRLNDALVELENKKSKSHLGFLSFGVSLISLAISGLVFDNSLETQKDASLIRLNQVLSIVESPSASANELSGAVYEAERIIARYYEAVTAIQIGRLGWGFQRIGESSSAAKYYQDAANLTDDDSWKAAAYRSLATVQIDSDELGGVIEARASVRRVLDLSSNVQEPAMRSQRCQTILWWNDYYKSVLNLKDSKSLMEEVPDCEKLLRPISR